QHVLVAVDLTPHSKLTAEKAYQIATQFNASLSILHVIEPMPVSWITHADKADINDLMHRIFGGEIKPCDEEQIIAKRLQAFAKEFNIPEKKQHFCMGDTKQEILRMAQQLHCDLIV